MTLGRTATFVRWPSHAICLVTPGRAGAVVEIVGMVRDIGMTPTDLGEAPYVFRAVSPLLTTTAVMLTVGLLACVEPARRGLRIHRTDALKEA